jgi:hypothetical protein
MHFQHRCCFSLSSTQASSAPQLRLGRPQSFMISLRMPLREGLSEPKLNFARERRADPVAVAGPSSLLIENGRKQRNSLSVVTTKSVLRYQHLDCN